MGTARVIAWIRARREPLSAAVALTAIAVFTLAHLAPSMLLLDTVTAGGDTPAHHYLAGHLRDQLLGGGRIVSWAGGWWCGFPMFQYYFCLPYLLMALGSLVIPFNIAFKLVSVLGLLALPASCYAMGRLWRLPRPAPILLAVAAVPFLFVRTHTMWGVNVHSTLAGMIANSLSFALLPAALGSAWRDATDGRFRLGTVALFALLAASHFFTSVMAALVVAAMPLLAPRGNRLRSAAVLAGEGILAALLMAWWLLPLVAKSAFSMEFGRNWPVDLAKSMPTYAACLLPAAAAALWAGAGARWRPAWLLAWLGAAAGALFAVGYRLSPVFVNVRLWPFMFFAVMALAAIGLGFVLHRLRAPEVAALACLAAALAGTDVLERGSFEAAPAGPAAQWNYEGLERKPFWAVFEKLVKPLAGTPGRLANDLAPENNALGSSRVFEVVPHLTGKPILEGGLVNSAASSMFSYYVQSETSQNAAGFPPIVKPASFDPRRATRHLELFNVKHFIARWPAAAEAFGAMPEWRRLGEESGWTLFELTTHDGSYVRIPAHHPIGVRTDRWKECALEWLYALEAIDQPFAFLRSAREADAFPGPVVGEPEYRRYLAELGPTDGAVREWLRLGPFPLPEGRESSSGLDYAPIAEAGQDPVEGAGCAGRRWSLLFGQSPFFPDPEGGEYRVSYSFVNVFSEAARDAVLHYSNDDGVAIWLNGREVVRAGITGLGGEGTVAVHLDAGRNRLLHKLEQLSGGEFFAVRLTDDRGAAIPGVVCTVERAVPASIGGLRQPVVASAGALTRERVRDAAISFNTAEPGLPHLVSCSFYPNWRLRGGGVFLASPGFMLVYPPRSEVELVYGRLPVDYAGMAISGGALAVALGLALRRKRVRAAGAGRIAVMKALDATAGALLCRMLGRVWHACGRGDPVTADFTGRRLERILVIRPGGMGDMVLLVPVLKRLRERFPEAAIEVVCENRNVEVLNLAGLGDMAVSYDAGFFGLAARLLARRYDAAIDTEQFHNLSAVAAFLSRAPIRIGFKINPARNVLYTHLTSYDLDGHEGEQFLRLLAPLGIRDAVYRLEGSLSASGARIPPDAEAHAGAALRAPQLVVVHPGASTRYKKWDLSRFVTLVQGLLSDPATGVVLAGTAAEGDEAGTVVTYAGPAGGRVASLAGRLTLAETAALLARARLFVGVDSGLAHLAAALGVDTVVLFGPSDSRKWGLADDAHRVVRRPLACAPCSIFGYQRLCRSVACMRDIAADEVLAACRELLSRPGADGPRGEGTRAAPAPARGEP